jgi:hypothetical protein
MGSKKTPNFFAIIIVIIIGSALFKQFDFENLEFEKPVLALVYIVTLAFSIYFIIRDYKSKPEE